MYWFVYQILNATLQFSNVDISFKGVSNFPENSHMVANVLHGQNRDYLLFMTTDESS